MFDFIGKNVFGKEKAETSSSAASFPPFTFDHGVVDSYRYPSLYEEATEMLHVSMLIYSLTDLRRLAKDAEKQMKLKSPERILDLPLSFRSCLQILEDNHDVLKEFWGEQDHVNTMNSMKLIHARFRRNELVSSSSLDSNKLLGFFSTTSVTHSNRGVEVEQISPMLTSFGDENQDTDMVYAVGIDQLRKRITVAFRGSVTTTDFQKDAMISLNQQPNPAYDIDSNQCKEIGIHHGFYDYLLRPRENGTNKYQEIMRHVDALFLECERDKSYKLYVTGHSLGGALATLFSLHAAASSGSCDSIIPSPVSCVSVASPRVGDRSFQKAFCRLEEQGYLRHLRIVNDRDPVTVMPSTTGKKIIANFSPMIYIASKIMDSKFEENQKFCHTGIKLRLAKNKWELTFLGSPMMSSDRGQAFEGTTDLTLCEDESSRSFGSFITRSIKSKSKGPESLFRSQLPDVSFHLGIAYIENLDSVQDDLLDLSMNDLYKEKVASISLQKNVKK